jgi:hypothetical protein
VGNDRLPIRQRQRSLWSTPSRHSYAKIWYGPLKNYVCASRAHYRHVWPIQLYTVRVSVSSSDQGFSFSDVMKNDIFGWFFSDLAFLGGILLSFDSFRYYRNPSMKNTESIRWLYDWFTFSPDYVRGMKKKLRTSRNKISMQIPVTGARCTIVWAIRDGNAPYWRTHNFLMAHIKF